MSKIIQACNVYKEYDSKGIKFIALKGVSFDVLEGEFVAIMGSSGSGKTTLLNLMSTIDSVTSGEILIKGRKINEIKEKDIANFRRENIGFVFQEFNLLDNMSILDNIALPLTLNNISSKEILGKVHEVSCALDIIEQLEKYPYQLSGGQKQRATISRALVTSPALIFADEPTGALDSKTSSEILSCFRKIIEKFKTTIVMVTHDPISASYCDRILFLKDGVIYQKLNSNNNSDEMYRRILNILAEGSGNY